MRMWTIDSHWLQDSIWAWKLRWSESGGGIESSQFSYGNVFYEKQWICINRFRLKNVVYKVSWLLNLIYEWDHFTTVKSLIVHWYICLYLHLYLYLYLYLYKFWTKFDHGRRSKPTMTSRLLEHWFSENTISIWSPGWLWTSEVTSVTSFLLFGF